MKGRKDVIIMAVDFSALDKAVDQAQLKKDVEEAKNNSGDIPKGTYIVGIDKMEIKATKDGRPMFFIQARVKEGEHKNKCVFMNRVIYGTKNDGNMIQSVLTVLDKFQTDIIPEFNGYQDFVELVADIYEEIQGRVECEIDYDKDAFNSISIKEVFDV